MFMTQTVYFLNNHEEISKDNKSYHNLSFNIINFKYGKTKNYEHEFHEILLQKMYECW